MNKKKSLVFSHFDLCIDNYFRYFSLNKTFAETPEVSVSGNLLIQSKMLKYQITKEVFSTGTYNSGQPSESTLIMIVWKKC